MGMGHVCSSETKNCFSAWGNLDRMKILEAGWCVAGCGDSRGERGFPVEKKTTYLGGCLKYLLIFIPIWGRFAFWLIFFKWLKPPTRYTLPPFADDIFIWWFWKETIGSLSLGTPKNRISSLFHYFTSYNGFYTSQVVTLRQTNIAKTGKWTMKEDVNSYIKWGIFLPAMLGTTGG